MDKKEEPNTNINIDPHRTPVLYADSISIKSNENGVVLDFLQQLGPTNQFTVVSRIGLSKDHAQAFIEHLEASIRTSGERSTTNKKD
jgi:hypothetical protein